MLLMYESLNRRGIETQIVHQPNFCAEIAMLFSYKREDSQISSRLYILGNKKYTTHIGCKTTPASASL